MFNSKKNGTTIKTTPSTNIIGKGTSIQGDIEAEGSIRIEGTLIGNIKTQSKLILAPGAYLKGNIFAKNVEIGGTLEGKVRVSETLTLRAQAKVVGSLHTHQLIVDVGAQFNGQCYMQNRDETDGLISNNKKEKLSINQEVSKPS